MPETPTAHLVLTVPPAIAAAWDRLEPEAQAYWSQLIVHGWLRYILVPARPESLIPFPPVGQAEIQSLSLAELSAFALYLERKFGLAAGGEEPPHA